MKLHGDITINGKRYEKGSDVPWYMIYPFFLIHMFMFGGSGFLIAYKDLETPTGFLFAHGGFAIAIYLVFYLVIFGRDQVKWMFINASLGLNGIYNQIDWILSFFGRQADDFPWHVHVIPVLYFVLYTFLIRQGVMDLTNTREQSRWSVDILYILVLLALYVLM